VFSRERGLQKKILSLSLSEKARIFISRNGDFQEIIFFPWEEKRKIEKKRFLPKGSKLRRKTS